MEFLIGRDYVDPRLVMRADPSLARVMGHLSLCTCFAGMQDGENVAACLLDESSGDVCDIVNFAVSDACRDQGLDTEILRYVMDYARDKGFRYMEIGTGNAYLDIHKKFLKMGFRVIGVMPDYYQSDGKSMIVENSIVNRDMIRYRIDFQDGWTTWSKDAAK